MEEAFTDGALPTLRSLAKNWPSMGLPTIPILDFVQERLTEMQAMPEMLAAHLKGIVPERSTLCYLRGGSINPDHLDRLLLALRLRVRVARRRGGGPVAWIKNEWKTGKAGVSKDRYSSNQITRKPPVRKVVLWRMKQQQLLPRDLVVHLRPEVPQRSIYRYLKGGSIHSDHLGKVLAALHLDIDVPERWGGGSTDVKDWGWGDEGRR